MKGSLVALLSASVAAAESLPLNGMEPCLAVNLQIKSQPDALSHSVDPELALMCLRSVPLDTTNNTLLLTAFKAFTQLESNLAYIKDPPPGSLYPPVDILAGIDEIRGRLSTGKYTNEYDFQYDLWTLTQKSHDYHYVYSPDIIDLFVWKREQYLFSVSKDGVSLPEIYLQNDAPALAGGVSDYKPSPVVKIDGVNVEAWLNEYASQQPFGHDPDANYNNVLWSGPLASVQSGTANGTFAFTTRPQKLDTRITFANETKINLMTYASTIRSFDGVVDGRSFFETFCTGKTFVPAQPDPEQNPDDLTQTTTTTEAPSILPTTATLNFFTAVPTQTAIKPPTTLFPDPLVITGDYSMAGYLPAELPDTAILQIPSFGPAPAYVTDFQNGVRALLATALARGVKKLVVDLRGNGGGKIYVGYDTFRQIFPKILPYGGTTVRSTPLVRDLQKIIYDYTGSVPEALWSEQINGTLTSSFNLRDFYDKDNKNFTSPESFLGPYSVYNDDLTAVQRTNLNQSRQTLPVNVYGFGDNILPIQQAFQPENIVILQDGLCGSTCAVFAEFMKSQGNVKTVVVGGRKQHGPMQAVGGTKGAEVLKLSDVQSVIVAAASAVSPAYAQTFKNTLFDLDQGFLALFTRTNKGAGVSINYRNNIREGDSSVTPLQYVYEAADCRFFYTPEMIGKQSLVWKMARDIIWGSANCVIGSADHPSSLSGPHLSYIDAYPPTGANYTFEAKNSSAPSGTVTLKKHTVTPSLASSTGPSVFVKSTTYAVSKVTLSTSVSTAPVVPTSTTTLAIAAQTGSSTTTSAATKATGAAGRMQTIGAGGLAAAAIAVHLLV